MNRHAKSGCFRSAINAQRLAALIPGLDLVSIGASLHLRDHAGLPDHIQAIGPVLIRLRHKGAEVGTTRHCVPAIHLAGRRWTPASYFVSKAETTVLPVTHDTRPLPFTLKMTFPGND